MKKTLWLDTETSGLDPIKNDIIQIAGIVEIDGEVAEEFDFRCQPFSYDNISIDALEVQGRTLEDLQGYQPPGAVYKKLIGLLEFHVDKFDPKDKFTPAGQNVRFDLDFLRQFFIKNEDKFFGSWFSNRPIDLMAFASLLQYSGRLDLENMRLGTIARKVCGVPDEFKAHDAMSDIRITRDVLKQLLAEHLPPIEKEAARVAN